MEGNLRLKFDWASLIVGRKFTVFAFFYFVFEAISKYKPPGGLYLEGQFNGGFLALRVCGAYIWEGPLHGGAYFRKYTVLLRVFKVKFSKKQKLIPWPFSSWKILVYVETPRNFLQNLIPTD